ncbi:hypothetical protein ACLOJK_022524 [Asimina triloba]
MSYTILLGSLGRVMSTASCLAKLKGMRVGGRCGLVVLVRVIRVVPAMGWSGHSVGGTGASTGAKGLGIGMIGGTMEGAWGESYRWRALLTPARARNLALVTGAYKRCGGKKKGKVIYAEGGWVVIKRPLRRERTSFFMLRVDGLFFSDLRIGDGTCDLPGSCRKRGGKKKGKTPTVLSGMLYNDASLSLVGQLEGDLACPRREKYDGKASLLWMEAGRPSKGSGALFQRARPALISDIYL